MRATGTMLVIAGLLAALGACRSGERKRSKRRVRVVQPTTIRPSATAAVRISPRAAPESLADGGDLRPPQVGDPLARAEELLLAGNPTGARVILEAIIRERPKSVSVWALLGRVYRKLSRKEDALRAFGRALRLEPEQPLALRGACQIRAERGDAAGAAKAVSACRLAVRSFPADVDIHFSLALSLMQAGQARAAVRELKWVAKREPQKADVRVPLGRTYLFLKQYEDAERELAAAVRLDPKRPLAWHLLARSRYEQRDLEGAVKAWGAALRQNAAYDDARRGLVSALRRLRRPAEAIPYLRELVERQPANAGLRRQLASTEIETGNYAAARITLEAAVKQSPRSVGALHNLGVVNEKLGRLDDARQALEGALDVAPARVDTRLMYANVLERLGRAAKALVTYDEVVRRGGGGPEARIAAQAAARLRRSQ